jgi:hypothetical protein
VAGSLTSIVHALDVLLLWTVGIDLAGDTLNDRSGLAVGESPAAAGREHGAWVIAALFEPFVQHSAGISLHGYEVAELPSFHLDAGNPLSVH